MLTAFTESRCPRGNDIRAFLGQLRVKREDLVAGVSITNKEYRSTIIRSLPEEMTLFTSSLLSLHCTHSPTLHTH